MKIRTAALILGLGLCMPLAERHGAQAMAAAPVTRDKAGHGDGYSTTYVALGSRDSEALLYEPAAPAAKSRIALVYSHPNGNTFGEAIGAQMARRGYRMIMVNYHGVDESDDAYAPGISQAIAYLRSLPGVARVVIVGHSGGGHLTAFYQNVAENGPASCAGPEKLYPCRTEKLTGLAKPDGMVLLDPTLGAFHQMSSLDPATGDPRDGSVDMFAPANGYDPVNKRATYSAAFAKRFHAAQAARNTRLVDNALDRLRAIRQGAGQFSDDEPFVVAGMGVNAAGARLYQPDTSLLAHTRERHRLIRADGTEGEQIIESVRPPSGQQAVDALRSLELMTRNTTVRKFLAASAIRTRPDFAITADDIVGVDWASAFTSTPSNARGITVPTLVLSMSCHYLLVPDEIIFNQLGSRDKTYAAIEGATHLFAPCRPQYGDTAKRTFDAVDRWLAAKGRF